VIDLLHLRTLRVLFLLLLATPGGGGGGAPLLDLLQVPSLAALYSKNICGQQLGWCREREKIDWQEGRKFDCRLVRTIFIFLLSLGQFWRVARKSNFDF